MEKQLRELVAKFRKWGETPWGGEKYNRCADELENALDKAADNRPEPPSPAEQSCSCYESGGPVKMNCTCPCHKKHMGTPQGNTGWCDAPDCWCAYAQMAAAPAEGENAIPAWMWEPFYGEDGKPLNAPAGDDYFLDVAKLLNAALVKN